MPARPRRSRRAGFPGPVFRVRMERFWAKMGYRAKMGQNDPQKEPQGALCGAPSTRGGGRDRGWTRRSQ